MDKTQKEREYLENKYAEFWKTQTHIYGIGLWEQKIIDTLLSFKPKSSFEVGIGTGWPIASTLQSEGVDVYGCDIADSSVQEACKNLNLEYNKHILTGDLMELDINKEFDATYCVRSSWYMDTDHFMNVLKNMIDITNGGVL